MRVLSLGGGVQSTTLLLMAITEQMEPLDAVIFADTGWEPPAVYRHLDWLAHQCADAGLPFSTVSAGNIRSDTLQGVTPGKRFTSLPFYVRNQQGAPAMLRRQCTTTYKVEPIQRQLRALAGMTRRRWIGPPIEQWLGISMDEATRMRDSREAWITLRYPLVERRMRRSDCVTWLETHGFPVPPKSACIGCPFHGHVTWQRMRAEAPADFADAVAFDAAVRDLPANRIGTPVFVHRSCRPLSEVDLSTPAERGQGSLFDMECEGHCGL